MVESPDLPVDLVTHREDMLKRRPASSWGTWRIVPASRRARYSVRANMTGGRHDFADHLAAANVELVRAGFQAFNAGDVDECMARIAPDFRHQPG